MKRKVFFKFWVVKERLSQLGILYECQKGIFRVYPANNEEKLKAIALGKEHNFNVKYSPDFLLVVLDYTFVLSTLNSMKALGQEIGQDNQPFNSNINFNVI